MRTAGPKPFNLAIETSGRVGTITLGRGDTVIASAELPQKRRHNIELTPAIDRVCREHDVPRGAIGEVYVSLGPGSFTGLRIALATVKMLALAGGVRVVGVPTLDVLAENAPPEVEHVAVCMNLKRRKVYCAVYERGAQRRRVIAPAKLRTIEELLHESPRPVALLGEPPPEWPPQTVTELPVDLAHADSEVVWRLGRMGAKAGAFTDPDALSPLYVREPEAVALWKQRHGSAAAAGGKNK